MTDPQTVFGDASVLDAIDQGAVLCTSTQRLSRHLRRAWDRYCLTKGLEVWETPHIMPYITWIQEVVRDSIFHSLPGSIGSRRLLTASQEALTWESAVRSSGISADMLQPDMLARMLMEAHSLRYAWDIQENDIQRYRTEGSDLYLRVLGSVREIWDELDFRPHTMLPEHVRTLIADSSASLPHTLITAGFDRIPDTSFSLTMQLLEHSGVRIQTLPTRAGRHAKVLLQYPSMEDEIEAAALWCRELLVRGESDIAVVLPSLDRTRDVLERSFADILDPARVISGHDAETGLFELSLGRRCADEPLLASAMNALELSGRTIPLETLSRILRSPFFAATPGQSEQRIRFEMLLRQDGAQEYSAGRLRQLLKGDPGDDRLLTYLTSLQPSRERCDTTEWSDRFAEDLDRMGWPGDRPLTSREFQARQRWEALREEFATFSAVLPPLTSTEALGRMRRLLQEQVFQPESSDAPVQIMGMLETAGMQFSHCRIIGMNEERWPPPQHANPFIPLQLQRLAGITEVLPDRNLDQKRGITHRAEALALDMTLSCSSTERDNMLLPTPLLRHLELRNAAVETFSYAVTMQQAYPEYIDHVRAAPAPELGTEEVLRGGTRVLALQSACPFRAFAELRLHAQTPDSPARGMQMRDRGSMLHKVLEKFWDHYRTQQELLAIRDDELGAIVRDHVESVLEASGRSHRPDIPAHLWDAEIACLSAIVLEWLTFERSRAEFQVIAVEEERSVKVGPLQLKVKVDRLDAVGEENHVLLIDYKSAAHRPGDWVDARIRDPQLPIYALSGETGISGLAYALLRRGECGFAGIANDTHALPPLPAAENWLRKQKSELQSWEELVHLWREGLEALAGEFHMGDARIEPRDGEDTCKYCTLPHLCRIDELRREAGNE